MKRLLFYCFILLAMIGWGLAQAAPTLQWDASAGAEGYNVYCSTLPVVVPIPTDAGNALAYDLVAVVTPGTALECWATAYAAGFSESADSNHIQFTPPAVVQTIIVPGQPSSVTISWE
jgi:hypothetical protein